MDNRVYGDSAFEGKSLNEKRTNALALIRHRMLDTRCHPRYFETMARGAKLFGEIIPKHYPNFLAEFHKSAGLSIDEYYLCLCMVMMRYTHGGKKGYVCPESNELGEHTGSPYHVLFNG